MPTPQIFTSVINGYLPEPQASLLNGIIFGVNLKTGKIFYDQLKIVGLLHLVVLSGINITLLATIVGSLTGFFGKKCSILITILVVILFIWFVGAKAPIVRAGFMGMITFVGILTGRKTYPIFVIFLSLLFILIFWPKWLTSLSLHLSYGATLGLLFFGQKKIATGWWQTFLSEFKTSLAAQVFTTPLIFIHFRQISLISPFSNALVAPVVGPLMIFGFITAILGKINFYLGLPFGFICYGLLTYILLVIKFLSKLPFVFFSFNQYGGL